MKLIGQIKIGVHALSFGLCADGSNRVLASYAHLLTAPFPTAIARFLDCLCDVLLHGVRDVLTVLELDVVLRLFWSHLLEHIK